MRVSPEIQLYITNELINELGGKLDGSRRNILVPQCPWCGRPFKYGIYVGPDKGRKKFGSSHCFRCGRSFASLEATLRALNMDALIPKETAELDEDDAGELDFFEEELDIELTPIQMPKGYKRCYKNPYLKARGWLVDDYQYFEVGTNRGMSRDFDDYVILPVIEGGQPVGYVARSTMSKEDIDVYNRTHNFKIRRYKNSNEHTGNGFAKLLYNYDRIEELITHSVILCEGPFDVIALTRKLDLYENHSIVPVATFGKKISVEQMYKLQIKGVEQVVIGYDNDAKETTSEVAMRLDNYFDVLIADIPDGVGKDWDEMDVEDIYDVFVDNLKSVREFNLS